jgi:hypothetical protein
MATREQIRRLAAKLGAGWTVAARRGSVTNGSWRVTPIVRKGKVTGYRAEVGSERGLRWAGSSSTPQGAIARARVAALVELVAGAAALGLGLVAARPERGHGAMLPCRETENRSPLSR